MVATQTLSPGQTFLFKRLFETEAEPRALYLVWLTFAAYLNLGVWLLNR